MRNSLNWTAAYVRLTRCSRCRNGDIHTVLSVPGPGAATQSQAEQETP